MRFFADFINNNFHDGAGKIRDFLKDVSDVPVIDDFVKVLFEAFAEVTASLWRFVEKLDDIIRFRPLSGISFFFPKYLYI